jgi:hypothetical protein
VRANEGRSVAPCTAPVTFTDTFTDTETFTEVVPCQARRLRHYDHRTRRLPRHSGWDRRRGQPHSALPLHGHDHGDFCRLPQRPDRADVQRPLHAAACRRDRDDHAQHRHDADFERTDFPAVRSGSARMRSGSPIEPRRSPPSKSWTGLGLPAPTPAQGYVVPCSDRVRTTYPAMRNALPTKRPARASLFVFPRSGSGSSTGRASRRLRR